MSQLMQRIGYTQGIFLFLITTFLVGSSMNCGAPADQLTDSGRSLAEEEIRMMLDTYRGHADSSRWDSMLTYYVNDSRFTWVEDGLISYRSTAEVLQALQAFPPNMKLTTTYETTDVIVLSNDAASVVTAFETDMDDLNGQSYSFGGMMTMTLIRSNDGWKILNGHTSGPKPRGQY